MEEKYEKLWWKYEIKFTNPRQNEDKSLCLVPWEVQASLYNQVLRDFQNIKRNELIWEFKFIKLIN